VIVDGVHHEFTGCTVAVGNSKVYGGGMYVLPDAEIDDGRLDVMFVKEASKLRLLALLPRVFKGTHGTSELVEFHRGGEIEVSSDRPFAIYADGDPIGATPAIMRVERRSLRVIAPS
jgi:diacylglycerol kinase family enzyme